VPVESIPTSKIREALNPNEAVVQYAKYITNKVFMVLKEKWVMKKVLKQK